MPMWTSRVFNQVQFLHNRYFQMNTAQQNHSPIVLPSADDIYKPHFMALSVFSCQESQKHSKPIHGQTRPYHSCHLYNDQYKYEAVPQKRPVIDKLLWQIYKTSLFRHQLLQEYSSPLLPAAHNGTSTGNMYSATMGISLKHLAITTTL